jgi:hypothetical protein
MWMVVLGCTFRGVCIVSGRIGMSAGIWVVNIITMVSASVSGCWIMCRRKRIVMMVSRVVVVLISSVIGFIIGWIIGHWCSFLILSLVIMGRG